MFVKRCKYNNYISIRLFGVILFGYLALFRSVIWRHFVRSFGGVSFGYLAKYRTDDTERTESYKC